MAKIAIMGFGTVGSGVYEVIRKNADSIGRKAGEPIEIGRILDIRDFSGHEEAGLFTTEFEDILQDSEISVVAEVIGGTKPAYDFTKRLLSAGKSVVTSNKELVATHGAELLKIAKDKGASYMFEASVGGGIPIIRPLHQCLAANEITEIFGILNGTTNYILTQMIKKGAGFEEALKKAQELGYAEANPAADIEGKDACRKIAILSDLAFGKQVDVNRIYTEGITEIDKIDVKYADAVSSVIKLIGYSRKAAGGKVFARVSPMLVPEESSLSTVDDVFNAILVRGDAIGEVMFYGKGAGKLPTASAVVADIIDIVQHASKSIQWQESEENLLLDIEDSAAVWFVRAESGCESAVKEAFGNVDKISVTEGEFGFRTPELTEKELTGKLAEIKGIIKRIRVLV